MGGISLRRYKESKRYKALRCGKSENFIIAFWERIFAFLGIFSIFNIIKKIKKGKVTSVFVEKWVLFNLMFAIISSIFIYKFQPHYLAIIVSFYGLVRAFEVIVYQINVLLFDPYRAYLEGRKYIIKGPTRMVILLIHNYIELIFWFATVYISLNILSGLPLVYKWSGFIEVSAFCFISNELPFVSESGFPHAIAVIASFEMIGGMIMTLISLARFIGILPAIESKEKF